MDHKLIPEMTKADITRFWSKVSRDAPDECWWWHGWLDGHGYARFDIDGRSYQASRIARFLLTGIDLGNSLACHECDEPECVNPHHIWPGSDADNAQDKALKGRATRGERNPQHKLSDDQVRAIRTSPLSGRVIARQHDVCEATVSMIRSKKTWKHV